MVAIVTGASDGIGYLTAKRLAQRGYTVYGISRSNVAFSFMEHFSVDVSDRAALELVLDYVYAKEGAVDLLVCCAGVSLASPAEDTTVKDARYLFDVNFWGCVYAARYVLRRMKARRQGKIVFVSSLTGLAPIPHLSFYSASKAALLSFASALAGEAKGFNIQVSAVAPGGVRTGFTQKRKKYIQDEDDPRYPGLRKAIVAISAIEQKGTKPKKVAKKIVSLSRKKNPKAVSTVGLPNHAMTLLLRVLPNRTLQFALRKVFSQG